MSGTIFAPATPPGKSGVAIIRVSGPQAFDSLKNLTGKNLRSREAHLVRLRDNDSRETIDRALVLCFAGPASFTGEDVAEYHVHGGRAVTQSVLAFLARQKNHRLAEPGEFTRRAFENGKIDLTEAEGLADLINAETQLQKQQALLQASGVLSRLYQGWSETLAKALAHMEADIEFPDEDLPAGIAPQITQHIETLSREIAAHLSDNRRGERLRDGLKIAVIGAPNAGKSSLVNALAQRDISIVSDLPGTTRDVVEAHLDLGGYAVSVADTAGLRLGGLKDFGHEAIESEGIKRALQRAKEADIKILLFDAGEKQPDAATLALRDENSVVVVNKTDHQENKLLQEKDIVEISALTGKGLEDLTRALLAKIKNLIGISEAPSLTRLRHRRNLEDCLESLKRSLKAKLPEMAAEDLRLAIRSLGRITGRVDAEDLLDIIFRDFCIGK